MSIYAVGSTLIRLKFGEAMQPVYTPQPGDSTTKPKSQLYFEIYRLDEIINL